MLFFALFCTCLQIKQHELQHEERAGIFFIGSVFDRYGDLLEIVYDIEAGLTNKAEGGTDSCCLLALLFPFPNLIYRV